MLYILPLQLTPTIIRLPNSDGSLTASSTVIWSSSFLVFFSGKPLCFVDAKSFTSLVFIPQAAFATSGVEALPVLLALRTAPINLCCFLETASSDRVAAATFLSISLDRLALSFAFCSAFATAWARLANTPLVADCDDFAFC